MRAVRAHERRTNTQVVVKMNSVPEGVSVPVKITVYRIIQEALGNAYRHAKGKGQQVQIDCERQQLSLVVSDQGPGFDLTQTEDGDEHMGLVGMRERVVSLGGTFHIESEPGCGTHIITQLPLDAM